MIKKDHKSLKVHGDFTEYYYNGIADGILIKDTPGRDQSPGGREWRTQAQVYSIGNSRAPPKVPGRDSVRLDI